VAIVFNDKVNERATDEHNDTYHAGGRGKDDNQRGDTKGTKNESALASSAMAGRTDARKNPVAAAGTAPRNRERNRPSVLSLCSSNQKDSILTPTGQRSAGKPKLRNEQPNKQTSASGRNRLLSSEMTSPTLFGSLREPK